MKKLLFFTITIVLALQASAQQQTVVAHRVMALDSVYVNGVWIKKVDIDRWNSNQGGGGAFYVDSIYSRNDSLFYTKDGQEYNADLPLYDYVKQDSLAGKVIVDTTTEAVSLRVITTYTSNGSISVKNSILNTALVNTTSGNITLSIAASATGATLLIKKVSTDPNTLTITPTTGSIDGSPNYIIVSPMRSIRLQFDGSNWWVF